MTTVMVSGHFDPLHKGHIRHFQAAKNLGNHLIVSVNSDHDCIIKKGFCLMSQSERMEIVGAIKYVDLVVQTIHSNGNQARTLKAYKPDIFAKGGDRTLDNLPQEEIDACEKYDIKLVTGISPQLNSSSGIILKLLNWFNREILNWMTEHSDIRRKV